MRACADSGFVVAPGDEAVALAEPLLRLSSRRAGLDDERAGRLHEAVTLLAAHRSDHRLEVHCAPALDGAGLLVRVGPLHPHSADRVRGLTARLVDHIEVNRSSPSREWATLWSAPPSWS